MPAALCLREHVNALVHVCCGWTNVACARTRGLLGSAQVTRADGTQDASSASSNIHINPSLINDLARTACVLVFSRGACSPRPTRRARTFCPRGRVRARRSAAALCSCVPYLGDGVACCAWPARLATIATLSAGVRAPRRPTVSVTRCLPAPDFQHAAARASP